MEPVGHVDPDQLDVLFEKLRQTTQEVLLGHFARSERTQAELAAAVGRSSSWASKVKRLEAHDFMSIGLFGAGLSLKPSDTLEIAERIVDVELELGVFILDEPDSGEGDVPNAGTTFEPG